MKNTATPGLRLALAASALAALPALAQEDTAAPVRYQYDAAGNLVRQVDPRGIDTVRQFDRFNQPVRQILPAPAPGAARPVLSMAYDHLGRLAASADARGLSTSWRNDGLGNLLEIDSPDSGATSMEYDQAGLLVRARDARGLATSYSYDALGRITRINAPGGPPARLEYDTGGGGATGRLTRMVDESGETRYRYDDAGRLVEKKQEIRSRHDCVMLAVAYAYGTSGGALGKLESITYPSGNRVVLGYSPGGKVTSMTLHRVKRKNPVTLLDNVEYEPFGPARAWEWGQRHHEPTPYLRQRDLDGRLVRYTLSSRKDKDIVRTVVYDAAGRVESYLHDSDKPKEAPADQSFRYDDLGRLAGFVARATAQAYTYDASGNRTAATLGPDAYSFAVDTHSNRMLAASGERGEPRAYKYDEAGNVEADGRLWFKYGPGGRVQSVRGKGWEASYLYNGLGQRVAKEGDHHAVGEGSRFFVYDEDGRMLGEYDARGRPIEETIFLGDIPVAVLARDNGHGSESSAKVHYVFTDHLGTPRVIERAESGKVVWRWDDADPFGVALPDGEHKSERWGFYNRRFGGQYYDTETDLYFDHGRSYDPLAARFGQSGLAVAWQPAVYRYAVDNPMQDLAARPATVAQASHGWREWIGASVAAPACTVLGGPAAAAPAGWQPPAPVPGTQPDVLAHLGPEAVLVR